MTGQRSGLVACFCEINPKISWKHCMIHKNSFVAKKNAPDLHETLNICANVVNFIKSCALNFLVLRKMCEEMESTHAQLLLHTEVPWLSRRRVLSRLFEFKDEVKCFL
ncbi:hypothetical protein Cfor_12501 [Coptotermes formosanus]|jgi:dihydroorotase-like cyclic amidohydrolase|uniref:Uncharacterized protein n=1 Tax=Coptotermes formosanus TaxID=36987 RepID=A0A6L2Q7B5_COPFO|nr:hypothetical protein Cfor_12501 [Coptotermes formosanus]